MHCGLSLKGAASVVSSREHRNRLYAWVCKWIKCQLLEVLTIWSKMEWVICFLMNSKANFKQVCRSVRRNTGFKRAKNWLKTLRVRVFNCRNKLLHHLCIQISVEVFAWSNMRSLELFMLQLFENLLNKLLTLLTDHKCCDTTFTFSSLWLNLTLMCRQFNVSFYERGQK